MTIRNPELHNESVKWNYGEYDDCFTGLGSADAAPVLGGDIDSMIICFARECLLVEFKGPGAPVPIGQALLFNRLVYYGHFTVVIVEGEKDRPTRFRVASSFNKDYDEMLRQFPRFVPTEKGKREMKYDLWSDWVSCNPDSKEQLRDFFKAWTLRVNNKVKSNYYYVPLEYNP